MNTKSYTFNGELDKSFDSWERWVNDALSICKLLGCEANYYSVGTIGKSGKTSAIAGLQRKITNAKKKNDEITWISIFVLPKEFSSVIFDYAITLSRNENYVTVAINEEYIAPIAEETIIDILRRNIEFSSGEVYEMDIYDCPESYAAKANPKEKFKSLKVIKSLV